VLASAKRKLKKGKKLSDKELEAVSEALANDD